MKLESIHLEKPGTKHMSFAVGSKYGLRSSKWIISTSNDDVYVSTGSCRRLWHISLHKSGRWHLKQNKGNAPILKSHKDDSPKNKYTVGLYIAIPDRSLRKASLPEQISDPDCWVQRPSYGGVIEIAIIRWTLDKIPEKWPGKAAGTEFLYGFKYNENEMLGVIGRSLHTSHPIAKSINSLVQTNTSRYKPIQLDSPERRGYLAGLASDKAILITEFAID